MLAQALRLIRVFHDVKQNELAARLGISKSHLSEIESGRKQPRLELIERYSGRVRHSDLLHPLLLRMPGQPVQVSQYGQQGSGHHREKNHHFLETD